MFLRNENKVQIIDKVEGNPTKINNHPAWIAEWDLASNTATAMDGATNVFCASGMHLPNGSFVTFGGNGAIGPGGNVGSNKTAWGSGLYDTTYGDYDGTRAIRVLNACNNGEDPNSAACQWFDNSTLLSMQKSRWYSGAEALADGSVVLIGGFVNGGYINRNTPNVDPTLEGGAAEPTYEFYPTRGTAQQMKFMTTTSGLNAYSHAYLMPSGKMFVQANFSTIMWDYTANVETPLPDMPGKVVRVYPASGATAMLPLTPANNYTPTILFCGGAVIADSDWGNYSFPNINVWEHYASNDCQRITPEPLDNSAPTYVQDDTMLDPRTMGQFIALPDGSYLIVNGGTNGTAGYATATGQTFTYGAMPYGMSLATGPVFTPALYHPNKPQGQRWSRDGLGMSSIPRLYHSSALLLPDASVLIAGSNPNVDYNASTIYATEYRAEKFYPPYFSAPVRPTPQGVPKNLTYGGSWFNITLGKNSYSGSTNEAAANTTVVVIRPGFTTHAMNMGQRFLQLNNTYTAGDDGTITLHVSQAPANPNLLTPGPVLMFVVVNGIPSNGTMVTVGSGKIETQPTQPVQELPVSVRSTSNASGSAPAPAAASSSSSHGLSKGAIIGIVAGLAILAIVVFTGVLAFMRSRNSGAPSPAPASSGGGFGQGAGYPTTGRYPGGDTAEARASEAFMPLHGNHSAYDMQQVHSPQGPGGAEYDPYRDYPSHR
ncbi:hypothetical protein BOTBODRAFT_107745 [Botryobasidium botryosum FD-172 SS1]|uniref:Glyoxal oxidase n=1 Tax=Botryobasidium botryosum (strain FD-172 SS1) TaxID=930990 RepID=A0A067MMV7_BOTB1|nr:hypothetical protein BOTBODRAFT_107745 [Botryobasidium botryosum FD-172 SS1]